MALVWAKMASLSVWHAMLVMVGVPALVMSVWTLVVERAHLRASTGLDFSLQHPWPEVMAITRTKMLGLAGTFGLFALGYFTLRTYTEPSYALYLNIAAIAAPVAWVVSPLYIAPVTRHMREPRDGLWHLGKLVSLNWQAVDFAQIRGHLMSWLVKAFFLAFMVSVVPSAVAEFLTTDVYGALTHPLDGLKLLIQLAFLFDVCFGTIGYLMTFRLLDSHIRSANPYLAGWIAALVCYPPLRLMGPGGPLDYRSGTQEWTVALGASPSLLLACGIAIAALAFIYAWATVIFGIRFSNLTHRGIITNGPYRWFRHPAYLSKNLMWWLMHLPFLAAGGSGDAVRSCLLLLTVNAIYVARAKAEERHLMTDPRYQAYSAWIREHGVLARMARAFRLERG